MSLFSKTKNRKAKESYLEGVVPMGDGCRERV
jgi:hypothetical protein